MTPSSPSARCRGFVAAIVPPRQQQYRTNRGRLGRQSSSRLRHQRHQHQHQQLKMMYHHLPSPTTTTTTTVWKSKPSSSIIPTRSHTSSISSSTALNGSFSSTMILRLPFTTTSTAAANTATSVTTMMLPYLLLSFIAGGIFFSFVRRIMFGSSNVPSFSSPPSFSSDGDDGNYGSTAPSTSYSSFTTPPKNKTDKAETTNKNRIQRIVVLSFMLVRNIVWSMLLGIAGAIPGRLLLRSKKIDDEKIRIKDDDDNYDGQSISTESTTTTTTTKTTSPSPSSSTTTTRRSRRRGWLRNGFKYYYQKMKKKQDQKTRKLSSKQLVGFQYVVDRMTPYVISRNLEVALKETLQNIVQIDNQHEHEHEHDNEQDKDINSSSNDNKPDDESDVNVDGSEDDPDSSPKATTNIIQKLTLSEFDIGPVPPTLTGARILLLDNDDDDKDVGHGNSPVPPPNMTFDVDVRWKSQLESRIDLVVERRFGGLQVPVVVRNVRFDGTVRLQFMPLVRNPPGFGSILVSFLHDPNIDADVEIYGGEVTNVPWVRSELLGAVRNAIREKFIWPRRLVLPARPPNVNATVLEESELLELENPGLEK